MDKDSLDNKLHKSWREIIADVAKKLSGSQAAQEARWMVYEVAGITEESSLEEMAKLRQVNRLNSLIERRLKGEPLQYVLGNWQFRTLDLMIDSRVLIPRPETEVLVGLVLGECERLLSEFPDITGINLADLGCGSGAIGLSVAAECNKASVWCTDISADAISVTRANLAGLGMAGQKVSISQGAWFEALPKEMLTSFHLVVSNPPYIKDEQQLPLEVSEWEPEIALRSGPLGTEYLSYILKNAPRWLVQGGSLFLELSPEQSSSLAEEARNLDYENVRIFPDMAGVNRVLVAGKPI